MEITKQIKMIIFGCGALALLMVGYFAIQWLNKVLNGSNSNEESSEAVEGSPAYLPPNVIDYQKPVTEEQTSLQIAADTEDVSTASAWSFQLSFIDPSNNEFYQFRNLAVRRVTDLIKTTKWKNKEQMKRADKYMDDLIDIFVIKLYNCLSLLPQSDKFITNKTKVNDAADFYYNVKFYEAESLNISGVKLIRLPIEALKLFSHLTYIDISNTGIKDGEIEKLNFMKKLKWIHARGNNLTRRPNMDGFDPFIKLEVEEFN